MAAFFVLVVIGVSGAFHVVMVLYWPSQINYAIIGLSWLIFAITIRKYYGFKANPQRERDEWRKKFHQVRTRNEELLNQLNKGQ